MEVYVATALVSKLNEMDDEKHKNYKKMLFDLTDKLKEINDMDEILEMAGIIKDNTKINNNIYIAKTAAGRIFFIADIEKDEITIYEIKAK